MAKGDYTDSTTKARYRALVKKPASTPTKVTVASDELRTRAEILDMVEELFESEKDVGGGMRKKERDFDKYKSITVTKRHHKNN